MRCGCRTQGFVVSLLVVVVAMAGGAARAATPADWTLMVFMNGSDLESEAGAATADLLEMMRVGSTGRIHVVVETLGTETWQLEVIDAERNQRFYVRRDDVSPGGGAPHEGAAGGGLELVANNLGLRPVDDPRTLADFIVWAVTNYPARRYGLILWDHGAGSVGGFGADERFEGGSLPVAGILVALQAAHEVTGVNFEVIGFDACLMSTVEVAFALSPFARYMVASEEVEPGTGWDYTAILQALAARPAMDGADLGRVIVDSYARHAREDNEEAGEIITLSVVDLGRVGQVAEALDRFVEVAGADVIETPGLRQFALVRSKAESFGGSSNDEESFDMVDVGDLVGKAAGAGLYAGEAQAVRQALQEAVVYRVAGRGKSNASGLSVWLPFRDKENVEENLARYHELTPFTETYHEFVETYARYLFAPGPPVRLVSETPEMLVDDEGYEYYTVAVAGDDRDRVFAVDSVLAYADPEHPDQAILLGVLRDALYDEATGQVAQYLPDELPALDGHLISVFEQGSNEGIALWTVPMLLNGRQVDLVVLVDTESWEGDVVGAWPGEVQGSNVAAREILPVRQGDRVRPLFHWIGAEEGQEEPEAAYVYLDEFVVGEDGLKFGWVPAPDGEYRFAFVITDVHQLETYSEFIAVEYSGGSGG